MFQSSVDWQKLWIQKLTEQSFGPVQATIENNNNNILIISGLKQVDDTQFAQSYGPEQARREQFQCFGFLWIGTGTSLRIKITRC